MTLRTELFIAGVQKAGTTSIDAVLRQHPRLQGPVIKETHVFDDETWDWSQDPAACLDSFYPPACPGCLRFEATPITSFWPAALERVKRYNAAARIVIILRDPIERAWSHWCMEKSRGAEILTFPDAIRQGRNRLQQDTGGNAMRVFSYVERSLYLNQVQRAQALFPASQLLFLEFGKLILHPHDTVNRIAAFAGVEPFRHLRMSWLNSNPIRNTGPEPQDTAYLQELLADDARQAAELAGIDASDWLTLDSRKR